eukprot:6522759-Prorocentrum_lima.AAC.1
MEFRGAGGTAGRRKPVSRPPKKQKKTQEGKPAKGGGRGRHDLPTHKHPHQFPLFNLSALVCLPHDW